MESNALAAELLMGKDKLGGKQQHQSKQRGSRCLLGRHLGLYVASLGRISFLSVLLYSHIGPDVGHAISWSITSESEGL